MSSTGLIERITDFLARVSRTGQVRYAASNGLRWLDREIADGSSRSDVVHPEDSAALMAELDRLVERQVKCMEVRFLRGDGVAVWTECRLLLLGRRGEEAEILLCARDISIWKKAEEHLSYMATHDDLTGLANRTLLQQSLTEIITTAERSAQGFSVMLLDLDGFKKVNDSLGHAAGDDLLVAAAARLRESVRNTDIVARLGGDEFVLVLPGTSEEHDIRALAAKLLRSIEQPFKVRDSDVYLSTSIGVALYPDHGRDEGTLLKHADNAMYQAKSLGKNRWQRYTPGRSGEARLSLEAAMHDAVRNGEFSLHYQPQFHAGRRTLAGVEALMRWERPGQGFVSPVEFIPLAEENGLINYLGAWALRAACHQTMRWHQQGLQGLTVSVNVSPKQFHQGNFSDLILQALQESGLPPQYLLLEITESILMHEPARTRAVLDKLRGRGVEFAVDDFGTGYSSLGYLKRFPLTALKIDRSFVRDIASDPNDRAIVGAVLGLARELNLYSVAEGVETEEQMRFLSAKGCDFIQGYLLGRPVPPAEILQRVNSGEWTVAGKVAG